MRTSLKNIAVAFAMTVMPVSLWGGSPAAVADTVAADTVDNRPFLKKIFKDFPIVYTDTAYTASDYIFVIKCTLMNHSWHYHRGSVIRRSGDTAVGPADDRAGTMVRFSSESKRK